MPNPKRRHSQQRSAKRRTHYKATEATLSTDKTTGELHVRQRLRLKHNIFLILISRFLPAGRRCSKFNYILYLSLELFI